MRALVVTSMYPSPTAPARGVFVRDQVRALSQIPDVQLELFAFEPGDATRYLRAGRELRSRYRGDRFDVVHAHFGLSAWPALAVNSAARVVTLHGTDLAHPRSRVITAAVLPFFDVVGPVSASLAHSVPSRLVRGSLQVLSCGVDTERFHPMPRGGARLALGLEENRRYALFASDPRRTEKRFDRAVALSDELTVLTLRDIDPAEVPMWVNAADVVLVPSEREGFGLAVLEALACDVPVLATTVGIAPEALRDVPGVYCGEFDLAAWRAALEQILTSDDPRVPGRAVAERYSAQQMAQRVLDVWRSLGAR
jgi:teichuronic acid biosynthesis glycosyltransferase TuaC